MTIRLPDGSELLTYRVGRMRIVDGVQYPERELFKKSVMIARGIKEVIRKQVAFPQYFNVTGEAEVEEIVNGIAVVTVTPTTAPRISVTTLAKAIGGIVRDSIKAFYNANKIRYDELIDADSPIYDLSDPYVADFEGYRAELKTAYETMRADILDIINGGESDAVKFQAILDYDWRLHLPTEPGETVA